MKRLLRYAPLMVAMILFSGCGKVTREYLVQKASKRLEASKVKYNKVITVLETENDPGVQRDKLGDVVRNDPKSIDRKYPFARYTFKLVADAAWLAKRALRIEAYNDVPPADMVVVNDLKQVSGKLDAAGTLLKAHDTFHSECRHAGLSLDISVLGMLVAILCFCV